ncbi:aminoglycoside phosphotransferase [Ornithinimicrobium sp. F0845]|uniref:aminoglycoside phosphotransferase n=1 Tax=Ornithinimicrobium sp. F0845 TaxID=2926412 RepID=UPI001FF6B462|nr:aminoglycoside phosphotransferase [Ornithinimicrobium sp. F0845]
MQPAPEVFDLFAVPAGTAPLVGGQGHSVLAGDLVLSPGRSAQIADWLNPLLARLAAALDHEVPRSLRLAMPIPTRDLRWVVDGWGATRFEPGARPCRDLDVLVATGRLLHAHLAALLTTAPASLAERDDPWAQAEQAAFAAASPTDASPTDAGPPTSAPSPPPETRALVLDVQAALAAPGVGDSDLGPDQLVHGDLAGNVLLDRDGLPVVIDIAPYWRPALWAEAVCVLDAVLWLGADRAALDAWAEGPRRHALLRAGLFRVLSDRPCDVAAYRRALGLEAAP